MLARVDYENTAPEWWAGFWESLADAKFRRENPDLYAALSEIVRTDAVTVSGPLARDFGHFVRALAGWDDPDAPEYAPHPLLITD